MKTWRKKTARPGIRLYTEEKLAMESCAKSEGFDSLSQWARAVLIKSAGQELPLVGRAVKVKHPERKPAKELAANG